MSAVYVRSGSNHTISVCVAKMSPGNFEKSRLGPIADSIQSLRPSRVFPGAVSIFGSGSIAMKNGARILFQKPRVAARCLRRIDNTASDRGNDVLICS